jgi:CubicO group peptidase (beta-lactamase class C family)
MSRSARALLARARHPAAIAVIEDGKVGWTETQGGSPETLFQAGSISKPVSALVTPALVARGEIDLDQEINSRLTSWQLPGGTGVSVRDLLGHTPGTGLSFYPGYPQGSSVPTPVQSLRGEAPASTAAVRAHPAALGSFSYSGGGYAVLQQLIADVTGVPFWQAASELVLAPLGMTSSTFCQPLPDQLQPLAARPDWHVYPEAAPAGLWTTPADLATFCCALQAARTGGLGLAGLTSAAQLLLTRRTGCRPRAIGICCRCWGCSRQASAAWACSWTARAGSATSAGHMVSLRCWRPAWTAPEWW